MRIYGTTQSFRAIVSEPEPGRVLVETNLEDGGAATTFTVDAIDDGRHASVTIVTEGRTQRAGLLGAVEERLSKLFLRRVYVRELALLDALAQQRYAALGAGG
jgi:hypothetical protein